MSEKNDDSTKNAEPSQTATCETMTDMAERVRQEHDWNDSMSENSTVSPPNYEVALEEILKTMIDAEPRFKSKFEGIEKRNDVNWKQAFTDLCDLNGDIYCRIRNILRAVNK